MKYIVIGDIHSCDVELEELVEKCEYKIDEDVLVSLGDIADRNKETAKCFEFLIRQKAILISSNHDHRLIRWRNKERQVEAKTLPKNDIYLSPVHQASLNDINAHPRAEQLWAYIENSQLFYHFEVQGKKYACCHGGVLPTKGFYTDPKLVICLRQVDPATNKPISYKPDREETGAFWADLWKGPEHILFGHSVFDNVRHFPYATGLDSGCVYGGYLSAMVVDRDGKEEIVQVKAKKVYHSNQKA